MLNHAAAQLTRQPDAHAQDDSAETKPAPPAPPASVPQPDTPARDDSAETEPAPSAPPCPATPCPTPPSPTPQASVSPCPVDADVCTAENSEESRKAIHEPEVSQTTDVSQATDVSQPAGTNQPADASQSTGTDRSLLDQLLDEADALREAEAAPSAPHEASATEPTPERGASGLRQQADAARRAFDRADALVSLAQGYLRGDRPNRSPIEVTITIPATSLRAAEADPVEVGEMGESFLSPETARRLSCDSGVVEVTEDEHGVPLSVGRKRRTIAGALKRALHKRDKTCTYPGCTHRIFLEGHHIQHWAEGGETSLRIPLSCAVYTTATSTSTDTRSSWTPMAGRNSTIPMVGWSPRCHRHPAGQISAGRGCVRQTRRSRSTLTRSHADGMVPGSTTPWSLMTSSRPMALCSRRPGGGLRRAIHSARPTRVPLE